MLLLWGLGHFGGDRNESAQKREELHKQGLCHREVRAHQSPSGAKPCLQGSYPAVKTLEGMETAPGWHAGQLCNQPSPTAQIPFVSERLEKAWRKDGEERGGRDSGGRKAPYRSSSSSTASRQPCIAVRERKPTLQLCSHATTCLH